MTDQKAAKYSASQQQEGAEKAQPDGVPEESVDVTEIEGVVADAQAAAAQATVGSDSATHEVVEAGDGVEAEDIEGLRSALAAAREQADKNRDSMLRTQAEMENLRKRQRRELENAHKFALDKIAMELLPVCDTLEMGIAAGAADEADKQKILEGTEMTLRMLSQALEKFNIITVNPVGEKFDPDLHQAISMQEGTDAEANSVLSVLQKGYTLNERLLRPAMVILAK